MGTSRGWVSSVGDISSEIELSSDPPNGRIKPHSLPGANIAAAMAEATAAAKQDGDTLGGRVRDRPWGAERLGCPCVRQT